MEYATLKNGGKIPISGYGVYQATKDEYERCVSDALKIGFKSLVRLKAISTKKKSAK